MINICRLVVLLKRKLITLELRHVEINISSSAFFSVGKNQSDYSFFDPRDSLLGQPF